MPWPDALSKGPPLYVAKTPSLDMEVQQPAPLGTKLINPYGGVHVARVGV